MYEVRVKRDGKSIFHAHFEDKDDAIQEAEMLINLNLVSTIVEVYCVVGENIPACVYSVRGRLKECAYCGKFFNIEYSPTKSYCDWDCDHWDWIKNTKDQGD
jgi:hypothetical protein